MNDAPKQKDFIPFLRDTDDDISLRPKRLNEFIGQDKVRANLNFFIQA
jgi:Holliday junction resolvasome RuvABC ATP-dependent DNA helicase subunit